MPIRVPGIRNAGSRSLDFASPDWNARGHNLPQSPAQGIVVFVRRKTPFRGNIALRAFAFATGHLASLLLAIVTDAFRATRNGYR